MWKDTLILEDGREVEIDRHTPMGIINQNLRKVEKFISILEESGEADFMAVEILRELLEGAKKRMIDTFHFIEHEVGKIYLFYALENEQGIMPGAQLGAEVVSHTEYVERKKRHIKKNTDAMHIDLARRGDEAVKRILQIHDYVELIRNAPEKEKTWEPEADAIPPAEILEARQEDESENQAQASTEEFSFVGIDMGSVRHSQEPGHIADFQGMNHS